MVIGRNYESRCTTAACVCNHRQRTSRHSLDRLPFFLCMRTGCRPCAGWLGPLGEGSSPWQHRPFGATGVLHTTNDNGREGSQIICNNVLSGVTPGDAKQSGNLWHPRPQAHPGPESHGKQDWIGRFGQSWSVPPERPSTMKGGLDQVRRGT